MDDYANILLAGQNMENMLKYMSEYIESRKKFGYETRFLMLLDKFKIVIIAAKITMLNDVDKQIQNIRNDEENINDDNELKKKSILLLENNKDVILKYIDIINMEIEEFEDFIMSDTKSYIKSIHDKIDEVLMGPYYTAGIELMKNSETDLNDKINEMKIKNT
uniref:Uncharacterized protein n=1 Tax=Pithovirus LCPAC102 TaxID=2506587 RepID=A0A481Z353_9VIRU|nr:MAG: hypothetical protein LCPAC102_02310 [Pithovirus LCPAC102]